MKRKVLTVVGVVVLGLAGATLAWAATGGASKAQRQAALKAAAANRADDAIAGVITINGEGFTSSFAIEGYSHEIATLRDAASGLPTGKRQHSPLVITKELDKSTPLLMNAQFQNRTIKRLTVNLLDAKTNKPNARSS
jgi:type VI secretion system Hcp family effector